MTTTPNTPAYIQKLKDDWGGEKLRLLKDTIASDLTIAELGLFCEVARAKGLDPFARQIYAVKRGGKMTIQTGIDGFRSIAERTKKYRGQSGPWWCGEDGIWKEVWTSNQPPFAAKVEIHRQDFNVPLAGIAHFKEYAQSYGLWKSHPCTMIAKCAESVALRRAFPQQLSGIYTADEISTVDEQDLSAETLQAHVEAMQRDVSDAADLQEHVSDADFEEVAPEAETSQSTVRSPQGEYESATAALLDFASAVDDCATLDLLDLTVAAWSEELGKLRRGESYARAWALRHRAELLAPTDSDLKIGLKDDEEHERMAQAILLMRSNRADAQGEKQ